MIFLRALTICCCMLVYGAVVQADSTEKSFDSEKMISDLEKQIDLSREQWEKLKPVLEQKSRELQQSMHESVDKGYAELEELSKKLDAMSRDAERKAKELLSSEEARKLKEYLGKIDEDAIRAAADKMVAELTALLELTEAQAAKIQPVLQESILQLNAMLQELARDTNRTWESFITRFDHLMGEMSSKLQETLDSEQMEKLQEYNDQQKETIRRSLYSV